MIADGIYEEVVDNSYTISTALVAAGAPLYPPSGWYEDPKLTRPTPLTISEDGQIKGHIAAWETSHIGLPAGTRPPRSASNYSYFKTGLVKTDDGKEIPVGQLTLAGGHAPLSASAGDAVAHYDDTASSIADVTVGEDAHGIWISGGLRPNADDIQIRALRASAPSGDWRPINGQLELVAVCQVNTPGFPVARAMVASGEITALVAAGAVGMTNLLREEAVLSNMDSLYERIANLESVVAAGGVKLIGTSDPATVSVELHDEGASEVTPAVNAGTDTDNSSIKAIVDITAGVEDDSVPIDSDPAMEVVAAEGTNTPTVTQKFDSANNGISGGDGGGDEADAAAGQKSMNAAAAAAEKTSCEVNGDKQSAKKTRLQERFKKNLK